MDKKKLIRFILIVLLIIIALIVLEVSLRGLARVTESVKTTRQIRKEEKEYQQTEQYATETYLESSIQSAVELIKMGDYEAVYHKLDPVYKDFMQFDTLEIFQEYMNEYIGTPISVVLMSYKTYLDKYICQVAIETKTQRDTYTVLVTPRDGDDFYIIFDNIFSIEDLHGMLKMSNIYIDCDIHYKCVNGAGISYMIDIKNNTNKILEGSFAGTKLVKTDYKSYQPYNDVSSVKINPGETVSVRFDFDERKSRMFQEQRLDIDYVGVDGETFNMSITL